MSTPLLHIQTPGGGFTVPLTHQPLTIGRARDNLVHLEDDLVSPHHCVLLRIGEDVHVVDLRSATGTLINGGAVAFARVHPGDLLRVGHAQVKIIETASEPVASAAVAGHAHTGRVHDIVESERPPLAILTHRVGAGDAEPDSPPIKVVPDADLDRPRLTVAPRMLGELMLPRDIDNVVRGFLGRPSGLAILCGPKGTGRSTTAYAMLRVLAANRRRIATFEQPPEFQLDGAEQVFVHNEREYALQIERALQNGPQVLMLGEPPTRAAANVAARAGIGRCLVIAVSEAPETIFTIPQWLELGVQAKNLAASLGLVLSQRLVRRLCDQCKQAVQPNEEQARKLAPFAGFFKHIYAPDACPMCNNTGFVGRIAVFEVLQITDELRGLILNKPSAGDIRRAVNPHCYIPLKLSAYARVAQGLTTMEEAEGIVHPA